MARGTSTSSFGVSRRENHDATSFYRRFVPPEIAPNDALGHTGDVDRIVLGDARAMTDVADDSVALVVTSPPYFAGKEYEEDLGRGGTPATYLEYLDLLRDVFAECARTLEPGGRIAVNVANLGRRPFRSLSADVTAILQDDLRLLLRGEIVWQKQRGASGSCAWGSFQRSTNPVLRDLTERVVVASKGRFDRAVGVRERAAAGLPHLSTMTREDFMENTLDVWEIPPESARRVGHPAPFPVELPRRLVRLYTYAGDLVLDPFLGAGSTAVAAVELGRHFVGYDVSDDYVAIARRRIDEARRAVEPAPLPADDEVAALIAQGRSAHDVARAVVAAAGLHDVAEHVSIGAGLEASFRATCGDHTLLLQVAGALTSERPGLCRADVVWRALGEAVAARGMTGMSTVLLAPGLPEAGSSLARALRAAAGPDSAVIDVIDLLAPDAALRLGHVALRPIGAEGTP